jgi:hypothetical protein
MLNFNNNYVKTKASAKASSEVISTADPDDQAAGGAYYAAGAKDKKGVGGKSCP